MKNIYFVKRLIFLFFISFVLFSQVYAQNVYTVERIIDGDTFVLTNGEKVRLIEVDTPESRKNQKAKRDAAESGIDINTIKAMGKRATKFVKSVPTSNQNRCKLL